MPDGDEIRLTLPADADLAPVVVAAVGAAVKAAGLGPDAITRERETAGSTFRRHLDEGSTGIAVTIRASATSFSVEYEPFEL